MILEGAVIAYESNLRSGGAGARHLGLERVRYLTIGFCRARLISTKTGEVLLTKRAQRVQLSGLFGLLFFDLNTELVKSK